MTRAWRPTSAEEHGSRVHAGLVADARIPGPDGWLARLDLETLAYLRRVSRSGAFERDRAILEEAAARKAALEAERRRLALAAQLDRINEQRGPGSGATPLERATAYLLRAEGGVLGDGRNPKAWGVVQRVVRGFALEEDVAFALLSSDYAPRCKPDLPGRVLAGMIRRAIRSSRPPWGYLLVRENRRAG